MSSLHKAFILGAGLGTRLKPLTDSLPKPLVPLYHEPLVNYALRHCISAGIDEFAINTHHLPKEWDTHFPSKLFEHASIEFFYEEQLLETGGGLKNIATFIGNDPLLVYNGDILTDLDLTQLIKTHQDSDNIATLALFPSGPNCNVAIDGDHIIDMRHALGIHPGTHQFTGIYCIEPEILDLIPENEKISIIPAFLELAQQGKLGHFTSPTATWHDLGTRDSYFQAHHILREKSNPISPKATIDPNAEICKDTCVIGHGATIGKNAKLRNTIVWPNATVADNSILNHCIVRHYASGNHQNQDL